MNFSTDSKEYRHLIGKQNKNAGKAFEDLISVTCERYRMLGKANIQKTPEPMKVLKRLGGGQFVCCFEKKAQPDYKGTLANGQAIIIEAKHTISPNIQRKAVNEHQSKELDLHQQLGAKCFVLLSFGFRHFYLVPWNFFKNCKDELGRQYINPNDIKQFEIKRNGLTLDFLSLVD